MGMTTRWLGQAATPRYMPDRNDAFYAELSPALAFYTFFPIWDNSWRLDGHAKSEALEKVLKYSKAAQAQTTALIERQKKLIGKTDIKHHLSITAKSISPFMTGTGMEHPLENGFAFLQPYGLPYLAGSSIKGVLRNTARLLARDAFGEGTQGWIPLAIETLFGSDDAQIGEETAEETRRGALTFWDVIVSPKIESKPGQPPTQSLKVDILTPHQSHYLQGTANPHDSGDPVPVPFLAVGAGAEFNFHIQANPTLLDNFIDSWQSLIEACFKYTFDWLGFGAKTAVGYGVLTTGNNPSAGTPTADILEWESADIRQDKGAGKIIATATSGDHKGKKAEAKVKDLKIPDEIQIKLDAKKPVKAKANVEKKGNLFVLIGLKQG